MKSTPHLVKTVVRLALITVSSLSSLPAHSTRPEAVTARPLAIDDVLTETTFQNEAVPLGVSRDGKFLAYTTTRAANSTAVWIFDLQTRASTNISEGLQSASSPIWSPDGQRLAFLASNSEKPGTMNDYEVWIWNRSESKSHRLTAPIARPYFPGHLIWTADSRFLITDIRQAGKSAEPTGDRQSFKEKAPEGVTVREQFVNLPPALTPVKNPTSNTTQEQALELLDIGHIDVRTGEIKRIAERVWPLAYAIAPNGSAVAVVTQDQPSEKDDLWITDPTGNQLRKIVSHFTVGRVALSWSPNRAALAVHSANQLLFDKPQPNAGECVLIDLSTSKQTRFSVDQYDPQNLNIPLWTDQSDAIVLVERGKIVRHSVAAPAKADAIAVPEGLVESVLRPQLSGQLSDSMVGGRLVAIVKNSNNASTRVVTIDPVSKVVSPLGEDGLFYTADASALAAAHHAVVLGIQGISQPFDFFRFDIASGKSERLTHLNPQYDRYTFGRSRRIAYRNAGGEERTAILLLPADSQPGTRYPTLVFERDRADANSARHFGFWGGTYNMHIYATRGYAILYPDIEISRAPHERVTSDVLPAVDAAIQTGIVDGDRLALYGHSLGGYHAMMLLVQTTRFKAAIVSEGYYNLFTLFAEARSPAGVPTYAESFFTGTLGPPWQYPDRYIDNSPYMSLNKLTTPILLIRGSHGFTNQGDQLFAALQRAGKTTEYLSYEGEAHNADAWSLGNRRDYVTRTIAWLDFWLRPQS